MKQKATNTSTANCKIILEQYLAFFQDRHVWITKNESGSGAVYKTKELMEVTAKKYYRTAKNLAPIEGIWKSTYYTIAVVRDDTPENEAFVGVILNTENTAWKKGEIKIEFTESQNGEFTAFYYMGDHSMREKKGRLMQDGKLLEIDKLGSWSKQFPLASDEKALNYAEFDPRRPTLEVMDDDNVLVTIPSFLYEYADLLDTLMHKNRQVITTTQNLIIDIRENGGGSDFTYYELMAYLYTDTIYLPMSGMYLLEHNIKHFKTWLDESTQSEWRTSQKRMYNYMNTLRDTLIYWSDEDYSKITYDTVYLYPKNVAVLTNRNSASSAETFVLRARQSSKVITFGENTGAAIDGFNVHSHALDCYSLSYPTGTRSRFLPIDAIEPIGIRPDIPMNVKDTKMIEKVVERLNRILD